MPRVATHRTLPVGFRSYFPRKLGVQSLPSTEDPEAPGLRVCFGRATWIACEMDGRF